MRRSAAIAALLLLTACGRRGDIEAAPGQELPPTPYGASARPTPADMLLPPPQAAPVRVDDPVKRSEERREDRFELPPPEDR